MFRITGPLYEESSPHLRASINAECVSMSWNHHGVVISVLYNSDETTRWVMYIRIVDTLRPKQNGRHFADDIFKCFFLNENVSIPIKISLRFVPKGPINNIPAMIQIMAWRRQGDKPLSKPMLVSLLTHICVTRPQSVNHIIQRKIGYIL